jgi:hypothetical protein
MSLWHPSRASPDFNSSPSGFTRTYTAGASITANNVVSLHTDGKVYPSSSSYPNVIGVALNNASSGNLVSVLIIGIATAVSDGSINSGSPITFSTSTAGRVVAYSGHSHSVTLTTGTAVTGVSSSTGSFLTAISNSTGTFVNSITVDKRDFATASVLSGIGTDTSYSTDSSGYIRHTHSTSTTSVVTGITSTSGTTVVANVTAGTGTVITGVTPTVGTAVTGVSSSTGTFVQNVSVNASLNRVIGIALSSTTGAGQNLTILILPAWI